MKFLIRFSALVSLFTILAGGCSDPVSPPSTSIPTGTYAYRTLFSQGDLPMRRHQRLVLASQTQALLYDTLFHDDNGTWVTDSISRLAVSLQSVGNGYYRGIGIRTGDGAEPDTTLRYWLFSRRGDSLYTFIGHAFNGSNIGIVGRWETAAADTVMLGSRYVLDFRNDSVAIQGNTAGAGSIRGTFRYATNRDTLRIMGAPVDLGDRFSVTPGWGLYITSRPVHGYGRTQ